MPNRELQILITAKDKAQQQLKGLQSRVERMQPAFQKMAFAGTVATGAIGLGIGKAVSEASRVKEIDRLFEATFTNTEKNMHNWAENVADKFGRAEHNIEQMAATAGSVLKPAFSISEKEIAEMTKELGEASIALAATDPRIKNAQQAMEGFTQAMTGNRQRVIDWGFQVRDAQLEAEALKQGIIEQGEALTQQQKAMLTSQMIMDNVSVSQEVLKKSQEDWSQISKRLKGKFSELLVTLGNQFIPIIEDLGNKIVPIVEKIGDWIKEHPKLTKWIIIITGALAVLVAIIGALGIALVGVATAFAALSVVAAPIWIVIGVIMLLIGVGVLLYAKWDEIKQFLIDTWEGIKIIAQEKFNAIKDFLNLVWNKIKLVFKTALYFIVGLVALLFKAMGIDIKEFIIKASEFLNDLWDGIKDLFSAGKDWIVNVWSSIWDTLVSVFNSVKDKIKAPIQSLIDWITDKFSWIKNTVGKILDKAKSVASVVGGGIKGAASSVIEAGKSVLGKATGGRVNKNQPYMVGEKGKELFVPNQSGRIIPNNKLRAKGGGVNVNITVNGDVSGEELIEKVKRGIMGEMENNIKFAI